MATASNCGNEIKLAIRRTIDEPVRNASSDTGQTRVRRKDARPGEIIEAALQVFVENGFGAAKMDEIARRAKSSKGTIFNYFPTKEDLFKAVADTVLANKLDQLQHIAAAPDLPLSALIPALLAQAANLSDSHVPAIMRLLIAEARAFPDLADIWYDKVISRMLGLLIGAIERAQARGEMKPGDPRLYAFSILGPMLSAVLFRQVFAGTSAALPDMARLAEQHARTILTGLLTSDARS